MVSALLCPGMSDGNTGGEEGGGRRGEREEGREGRRGGREGGGGAPTLPASLLSFRCSPSVLSSWFPGLQIRTLFFLGAQLADVGQWDSASSNHVSQSSWISFSMSLLLYLYFFLHLRFTRSSVYILLALFL